MQAAAGYILFFISFSFFFVCYITGFRDWTSRLVSVIVLGCCFIINVYSASSCCTISGSFVILQCAVQQPDALQQAGEYLAAMSEQLGQCLHVLAS